MEVPVARANTPKPRRMPSSLSANSFDDDHDMSTIPDPRSRAMSPASVDEQASPTHHPDLNAEVATLSTKLINAINHQTTLDDTLSRTRMELEESREKIRQLEEQIAQQREMLAGDVWIRRKSVEADKAKLLSRVAEEKKARIDMEEQKKKMEQELENLTTALFEEANKMVISAKEEAQKEQEVVVRKNEQLKTQLADTEMLLKSQQEQLTELKQVMEQMSADRDDTTAPTAPSSPGFSKFDTKEDERIASDGASHTGPTEPVSPSYPTSFTHVLQPVLRTDLTSYDDFVVLVRTSKRLSTRSRPPSGSHSSFSGLGLGLGSGASASVLPSSGSTASLTASPQAATGSAPQTPNTPATIGSTTSTGSASGAPLPPLKDTKFYKRILAEDVEPTLRLDLAPGLSWLARRGVIAAMTDGSLVVEPVPQTGPMAHIVKPHLHACSLCGENRQEEEHHRLHRFRTSEADSAQRYPLCKYCLGRVRSTCDFLGFLRIVKDGHWRADDEDAERAAWEESVRLREQMFWSRIGGGVVPTGAALQVATAGSVGEKSPRLEQQQEAEPPAAAPTEAETVAEQIAKEGVAVSDMAPHTPEMNQTEGKEEEPKRLSLRIPS